MLGFGTPDSTQGKIDSNYWRFMMLVPVLIAILQLILLLLVFRYETPIFSLINKNNEDEAKMVLSKL